MEETKHETLTDETPVPAASGAGVHPWLVYLGSPENGFAETGMVIDLTNIRAVRFGRGGRDQIVIEKSNGVMRLKIPLGWISSVHAELRLGSSGFDYDYELRDLGSRNGTHLEREAIEGPQRVRSGQIIEIGRSFWLLRSSTSRPEPIERDALYSANPPLFDVMKRLERIARSNIPLLFAGETGVGKEHVARELHQLSGRRGAFIKQNLSALPEDRFNETLFGSPNTDGIFQRAHNGTLFFDELDALTSEQQAKLNTALFNVPQALEHRTGLPARIVCASHLDLHKLVSKHDFRGDLFSKIAGYQARIPPLRERREDLGRLCRAFLKESGGNKIQLVTRAFRRLLIHSWPFNIRELKQTLSTAVVLSSAGGSITLDMIEEIMNRREGLPQTPESVEELRRDLMRNLANQRGDVAQVARSMNRGVAEIIRLVERFGLHGEAPDGRDVDHTIVEAE